MGFEPTTSPFTPFLWGDCSMALPLTKIKWSLRVWIHDRSGKKRREKKVCSFMFLRSNNHTEVVKMEFATCFNSSSCSSEVLWLFNCISSYCPISPSNTKLVHVKIGILIHKLANKRKGKVALRAYEHLCVFLVLDEIQSVPVFFKSKMKTPFHNITS